MEKSFFSDLSTVSDASTSVETTTLLDYRSFNLSFDYGESETRYDNSAYNFLGPRRDALYIVLPITIIYLSIFITGTLGNVSTCIVIARNKSMHTATNYYLFSLAVSDLLLLVSGLPVEMYLVWSKYPYIFGEHFCRFRGLAAECSTNASVLTITAFTAERYVAICHPFLSHTMSKLSRAIKLILVVWLVALLFATPLAMQLGIVQRPDLSPDYVMCVLKVTVVKHSFEISTILFFVLPMILITVLYILIGLKLRQSNMMKRGNEHNHVYGRASSSTVSGSSRKDRTNCRHYTGRSSRRVLKMLVAVVVAFFLCWAPFHVQRLIAIYGTGDDRVTSKNKWMVFLNILFTYVSGVLYYVSATINPILYNIMSNKFREAFMESIGRTCGKRADYTGSQEQRSYSSLSRSQQARGTTGIYASRNVTGGSGVGQDASENSGNSIRKNSIRSSPSVVGSQPNVENLARSERLRRSPNEDAKVERSLRKWSARDSRFRNEQNLQLLTANQRERENRAEETSYRGRRWHENRRTSSKNDFVAPPRSARVNLTGDRLVNIANCNYEPVPINSNVARRKKWWRFLKWLPNAKAFGFRNNRSAHYASPDDSTINAVESNREEFSMTPRLGNELNFNQRLV